jgi:MOSC domain-containing protein YiiM
MPRVPTAREPLAPTVTVDGTTSGAGKASPVAIRLVSVSVGTPSRLGELRGDPVWSGIHKRPVASTELLWLSRINLAGDGQADLDVHGGPDKAVYAYPSEHMEAWKHELGRDLEHAQFGENLSTAGVMEDAVHIGDVWRWGAATLQVSQPRWPCFKLGMYLDRDDIQQRFRSSGRTGWYLRVLEPGEVPVAGPIELSWQDPVGISVLDAHLAMLDRRNQPDLVHAVAEHPALADQWRAPLSRRYEHRHRDAAVPAEARPTPW